MGSIITDASIEDGADSGAWSIPSEMGASSKKTFGSAVASALDIGGDIIEGIGNYKQGQDEANIAEYNSQIAQKNARIVLDQADDMARRSLVNSRKVTASAEAGYAASGVSGVSAQLALRNSAAQGMLEALTIKHNAEIKSEAFQDEAGLDRLRASNSRDAAGYGVAASIIGGVGDVAKLGAVVL